MVAKTHTKENIFSYLSEVVDPEIPVITIQEIGMLRDVKVSDGACEVILTPTYTACPAMGVIEQDIKNVLNEKGIKEVTVKLVYSPAWTTDWISSAARDKMKKYGITPPSLTDCGKSFSLPEKTECPRCGSSDVNLISQFGATACKSFYTCNTCKEPFEHFKCH